MPERGNNEVSTQDIIRTLFGSLSFEDQQKVLEMLLGQYLSRIPRINHAHQKILTLTDVLESQKVRRPETIEGLTVYFDGKLPTLDGVPLKLGKIQRGIIAHLALNRGTPTPTSQLYQIVWDDIGRFEANPEKLVHPAISRLRNAIGDNKKPHRIVCINEIGYYMPRASQDLEEE